MWSSYNQTDLFCITTNSYLRWNDTVVMGRGIARQAKERIEGIDKYFGDQIKNTCGHLGLYGLIIWKRKHAQSVAAFQVKYHFKSNANLDIIATSTDMLTKLANKYPDARFDLNFPGIGNGHLPRNEVLPIISQLPDNIHVWEYAK